VSVCLMRLARQIGGRIEESSIADLAVKTIRCQLSLNPHAIIEMISDHLSDDDVREVMD
jgi:hypothetical protein